jgi:peroxiredoxin
MIPDENDPYHLPANLDAPLDDGAARHLVGLPLPSLKLLSTRDQEIDLQELDRAVVFLFPRSGKPGEPAGEEWDRIPGARGCTPQALGFRDLYPAFRELGAEVFGVSTQTSGHQREFAARNRLPFELLSDSHLVLANTLHLPTFEFQVREGPGTLIKRMVWYVERGRIEKLWYPVFPPHENAREVLAWLLALASEHATEAG